MAALLDVNLLIALAWPNHVFHAAAHGWFRKHQSRGWATCPVTQSGFIRVSSNPRAIPGARSPREALVVLREITSQAHHMFWPDEVSLASSTWLPKLNLVGHQQVTDAHLLSLALERGEQLATFDSAVQHLLPAGTPKHTVILLPA